LEKEKKQACEREKGIVKLAWTAPPRWKNLGDKSERGVDDISVPD